MAPVGLCIHPFSSCSFILLSSSFLLIFFFSLLLLFSCFRLLLSSFPLLVFQIFFLLMLSSLLFSLFFLLAGQSFAFARQVTARRISLWLPRGLALPLTSVHHPSAQSSMISSSRFVIAHSLALTGSRRSGYLGSERGETWTWPNECIIDRWVLRSVIRRLPEKAGNTSLDVRAALSQVRKALAALRIL